MRGFSPAILFILLLGVWFIAFKLPLDHMPSCDPQRQDNLVFREETFSTTYLYIHGHILYLSFYFFYNMFSRSFPTTLQLCPTFHHECAA